MQEKRDALQSRRAKGRLANDIVEGDLVESQRGQRAATPVQFRLELSVSPGNKHEFDLWRFGLSPLVAMELPEPGARSSFAMKMASSQFADVAVSFGSSSAATFERSAQTIARSGLDSISLIVYLVDARIDIEGHEIEFKAGDVLFFDFTRRWKVRVPDFKSLSIILPRALLAPMVPDIDDLHGRVLPRTNPLSTVLVNHLQTLLAEAPALGPQDGHTAARGTAAFIAAIAGAAASGRGASGRAVSAASLHGLRRTVDDNLANPELGPEFLCHQLGMSRATLYRLFEPLGGVRRYIQQRRLTRAYQAVTDPAHRKDRVSVIATRHGFSSDSVFSRAFREAFGISPTDLRDTWKSGDEVGSVCSAGSDFMTVNRWLLGLDTAGR